MAHKKWWEVIGHCLMTENSTRIRVVVYVRSILATRDASWGVSGNGRTLVEDTTWGELLLWCMWGAFGLLGMTHKECLEMIGRWLRIQNSARILAVVYVRSHHFFNKRRGSELEGAELCLCYLCCGCLRLSVFVCFSLFCVVFDPEVRTYTHMPSLPYMCMSVFIFICLFFFFFKYIYIYICVMPVHIPVRFPAPATRLLLRWCGQTISRL